MSEHYAYIYRKIENIIKYETQFYKCHNTKVRIRVIKNNFKKMKHTILYNNKKNNFINVIIFRVYEYFSFYSNHLYIEK